MAGEQDITPYEIETLVNVIDLYVETGQPVSSRSLKSRYGLDASSANIRKILHNLEEKGLIYKPHISAGRIPTDSGYRLYVDKIKTLSPLSHRIIKEIRRKIGKDWQDIHDVLSRTSRLLGELTNYMGLIMGVTRSYSVVKRLRIVQMEGTGGLIILTLIPDLDRRVYVEFPKRYPMYVIDRAVQIINERITGCPLEEAPWRLESFLRDSAGVERAIAEAVSTEAEYLFDREFDLKYHFKGSWDYIENPSDNSIRMLQNLVRIMGERNLMIKVMKDRIDHEYAITIGKENRIEELENFSIITKRFSTVGCRGLLGILGPTRMTYNLVLSLLSGMAEELHRLG